MNKTIFGFVGLLSLVAVLAVPSVASAGTATYTAKTIAYLCVNGQGNSSWDAPFINSSANYATSQGVPASSVTSFNSAALSFFNNSVPTQLNPIYTTTGSAPILRSSFYEKQGNTTDQVHCFGSITVTTSVVAPVNGICGSGNGTTASSQPTGSAACTKVTFSDVTDTLTQWKWNCLGSGGGTTASCSAEKEGQFPYTCSGSIATNAGAWGSDEASPTTSGVSWVRSSTDTSAYCQYECNSGYTWNGSSCVVSVNPGQCGIADGGSYSSLPSSSSRCSTTYGDTVSDSTGSDGTFNWNCKDSDLTSGPNCSATKSSGPSANISAPNCTIASGASSCTSIVTWSSSNTTLRSVRQNATEFANSISSTGTNRTLTYIASPHTFNFWDNGSLLASDAATASCTSGTSWNGSSCVATASTYTITVNSSGASGVSITSTSGHDGITNYSKTGLSGSASATLTAPSSAPNGGAFSNWSGCSSVGGTGNRTCTRSISSANRTVTVNYTGGASWTVEATASPSSGTAPLNGVYVFGEIIPKLTTSTSYTWKWDCTNDRIWDHTYSATSNTSKRARICDYPTAGIYTAKVQVTIGVTTVYDTVTITAGAVPTVTSPTATSITTTGATLGANVTSLGIPAAISARGTCWGTTTNPTTNCTPASGLTTGVFTHARTGIPSGTLIYYRGYATNTTGTGYSPTATFTTSVSLPDLTAGAPSPTTATAGTALTFTTIISNIGTGSTGASFNNLFQVATAAGGGGTVSVLSVNSRAALAAGVSGPVTSSSYTFPSSGTYSVRTCADNNASWVDTITESNEGNNCGAWTNVTVGAAAIPFDYSLGNSGDLNVTKESTDVFVQNTISKGLTAGATQSVNLSVSGMPSGVSVSGISNQGCPPNCDSVITLAVAPNATVGTHLITVTGSPLNKTTSFNLAISGSPIIVICTANPSPALIGQSVTWTASVSGGVPPLTYVWSGTNISAPLPATPSFSKVYTTIGQKIATATVTDADDTIGACVPAGSLQVNFNPDFEEF